MLSFAFQIQSITGAENTRFAGHMQNNLYHKRKSLPCIHLLNLLSSWGNRGLEPVSVIIGEVGKYILDRSVTGLTQRDKPFTLTFTSVVDLESPVSLTSVSLDWITQREPHCLLQSCLFVRHCTTSSPSAKVLSQFATIILTSCKCVSVCYVNMMTFYVECWIWKEDEVTGNQIQWGALVLSEDFVGVARNSCAMCCESVWWSNEIWHSSGHHGRICWQSNPGVDFTVHNPINVKKIERELLTWWIILEVAHSRFFHWKIRVIWVVAEDLRLITSDDTWHGIWVSLT